MMRQQPVNLPASVSRRLLDRARAQEEDSNLLLVRYACERLLYRLSVSRYADRFILKGALLFAVWTGSMHRPTRDLDVLGFGDITGDTLTRIFSDACGVDVDADGLQFDAATICISEIRGDQEYGGYRVQLVARLGTAIIPLHVDVGIGDAVVPAPEWIVYPALLGFPAPVLRAYTKETVVAEKLHALVALGMVNSRMKDFYDLWIMAREFEFHGASLCRAIAATFERRATPIPDRTPVALTEVFPGDPQKQAQWQAFVKRSSLEPRAPHLAEVVDALCIFLLPALGAAPNQRFDKHWPPGGPWN